MTNPSESDPIKPNAPASGQTSSVVSQLSDPERWVDEHGDYLFKYALSRLRDPLKAEDAVQETFLAALKGGKSFQGRSAEKSWLVGILKNKIFDYYRKAGRETAFTDLEFYSDEESDRFVADGLQKDSWIHDVGPNEWNSPGAIVPASCRKLSPRYSHSGKWMAWRAGRFARCSTSPKVISGSCCIALVWRCAGVLRRTGLASRRVLGETGWRT